MRFIRFCVCLFLVFFLFPQYLSAQQNDNSFLNEFMNVLGQAAMDAAEAEIDEYAGTYQGKIGEVRLVERRGNAATFEVQYDGVKRTDGVYVHGEVMRGGTALEEFTSTISQVTGRRGMVRLTMQWQGGQEDPWGIFAEDIFSDQVKLYLLRETHPDRPFGILIYDFDKVWRPTDEMDNPGDRGEASDFVELAEGEDSGYSQGNTQFRPVYVGTLMKPVQVVGASGNQNTGSQQGNVGRRTRRIKEYSFFDNADKASWRSRKQQLPFPGRNNDKRGFALKIDKGYLSTGNLAKNMLETHPKWTKQGWIAGIYPAFVLGRNVKFKAVGGFIKGVTATDGVTFKVIVSADGENTRVLTQYVDKSRYVPLEADLSRFAGKKVRIILRVDAGNSSTQDWAVWVHPRLTQN